jgi:dsDNA-specific endonuclease/ATPase MutS2
MFKIGDKVSVLDDNINGVVCKINGNIISVETNDGFDLDFNSTELIVMESTGEFLKNVAQTNFSSVAKEKEIPAARSFIKEKKSKKDDFVLEIDLHIEKLVPNKNGLSNYDILNIQNETIKRQMDFALKNRIPKIVFIHGVGEGVLKSELDFLLGRYENITFQDANYQKYGLGATEVYFIQKKNI